MAEIVSIGGGAVGDGVALDPDRVLESAKGQFECVVVCGWWFGRWTIWRCSAENWSGDGGWIGLVVIAIQPADHAPQSSSWMKTRSWVVSARAVSRPLSCQNVA